MDHKWKLATILAAISAVGIASSAQAHIGLGRGGGGGGIRIGGGIGIGPRARQPQGNANANRQPAPPAAPAVPLTKPAPKVAAPAPVVQKPPVAATNNTANKPSVGTATAGSISITSDAPKSVSEKVQSPNVTAKTVTVAESKPSQPVNGNSTPGRLVFSLPVSADAAETGLPTETKKALEEVISSEAPAESVPAEAQPAAATEAVSKEVVLPQIPIGATLTLNGKDLSDKEGQVVLQIGEIALPATINEWKNDKVTLTLPVIGITRPSKATLHVLKADGKTACVLPCELVTTLTTSVEGRTGGK